MNQGAFTIILSRQKKVLVCACIILFILSCSTKPLVTIPPEEPAAEIFLPPEPDYLTFIAAGDNLFHDVMIRPSADGSYNFDAYYEEIQKLIKPADLAFINQETIFGGSGFGFSGYPLFNTPQEAGDAIINAGFDVVNHATNHIMDKGEKGIVSTLDYWDKHPEISCLGIHRTKELRDTRQQIIKKNNIRVGFLAYTESTNWIPLPADKPWLVSLVNTELMAKEIDALRPNCDFLIVSMHWGNEYQHEPNAGQEKLAAFLAEHQVDLVIGHHPHVIQPMVSIARPGGGDMICHYSLGNFISAQDTGPRLLGGLAYLKLKKTYFTETGDAANTRTEIAVEKTGVIPTVIYHEQGLTGFRVYPLFRYTEELAAKHHGKSMGRDVSPAWFKQLAEKIFGDKIINEDPFTGK
jgi:poly-gamma-glutamate synthesis protein (capsule biosynthesis protein)